MGRRNTNRRRPAKKTRPERIRFVARPFAGLANEAQIVAMREILPAATLTLRTNEENGAREFDLVTLLPDGLPALVRTDGRVLVALQTQAQSGDASHDVALALARALATAPGEPVPSFDVRTPGPRLQDLVDADFVGELRLWDDLGFWLATDTEHTTEVVDALRESKENIVPSAVVPGTENAFWCRMNRDFLRWIRVEDEGAVFDALARLHAAGQCQLGEGSRFVGAFRGCGIIVPVFEFAQRTTAEELVVPMRELEERYAQALATEEPLTAEQRRARAGLVSRQAALR